MSIKDDWSRTVGLRVKQKRHDVYGHISKMPINSHDNHGLIVVSLDSGGIYWMNKSDWKPVCIPSHDAWSGEGLPPAGVVVEVKHSGHDEWVAHKINYIGSGSGIVVFQGKSSDEFACPVRSCEFRTIRTPEQIAAEEREKAVAAMLELDPYLPNTSLGMMSRADFCRTLYDHGYLKQKDN